MAYTPLGVEKVITWFYPHKRLGPIEFYQVILVAGYWLSVICLGLTVVSCHLSPVQLYEIYGVSLTSLL